MNFNNIPEELRKINNWVLWKLESRKGKTTKIPYQTNGKMASSVNSDTWTTFDNALKIYNHRKIYSGIGFMFSGSNIVGLDFDHCINDDGTIKEEIQYIIDSFNSYTEKSQSGTGIHILVRGTIPKAIKRKEIEMYDSGRYFALTGDSICGQRIEERQAQLNSLYEKYKKVEEPVKTPNIMPRPKEIEHSQNDLLEKAFNSREGSKIRALYNGDISRYNNDRSRADQALCNYLAFWFNKDWNTIDTIFKQSGLYRAKWDRADYKKWTIENAIKDCNKSYQELREESIKSNPFKELEAYIKTFDFSNKGLLDRFLNNHRDFIKYINDIGMYIFWDTKKWSVEDDKRLGHLITDFIYEVIDKIDKYIIYLKQNNDDDNAEAFTKINKKIKNLSAVKVLKDNFINVSDWLQKKDLDSDENILNCQNGILDLNTGKLSPHDKNKFCTKITNISYIPNAKCPNFFNSLEWIFPNKDTRKELQKAYGYSLGGGMEQQVFFIILGAGENGKSTIMDPLKELMGEYYASLNAKSLEPKKDNTAPSSDFAKLIGTRCVISSEPKQGQRLDDGLLKTLAVGEEVNARFMRQNEFTYNPKYKLWIPSNKLPVITNTEHGFWRRLIIFPCKNKPKKRIIDFYKKYIKPTELPGVLNWALEGRKMLQEEGFTPTNEMIEALQEYKSKVNPIEDFVEQCCNKDPLEKIQTSELLKSYNVWALHEGHSDLKIRTFRDRLVDMGFTIRKADKNKSYVYGLNILKDLNFRDTWTYEESLEKMETKTYATHENPIQLIFNNK